VITKIVALFLVFMIVMGAVMKWLHPDRKGPLARLRDASRLKRPRKCTRCGRFLFSSDTCTCPR
jgi:hypothetical protein